MRQYIDIVKGFLTETADIIPFPNKNKNYSRPEFSPIGRDDRFNLVIATLTAVLDATPQRRIFGKVSDITLATLMNYFRNYEVPPCKHPIETSYWTTGDGKTQYDFHVVKSDGAKLSIQEFKSLDRMIQNDYKIPSR